ncbi:MAG TPA: S8 family serine peptidase [Gaiellaceae bacterium]|nr:S8 family serine peptidase [Gaiellaceae bacterium]
MVALGAAHFARAATAARTEVVVTLDRPSLVDWIQQSRVLTVRAKGTRLNVTSDPSRYYLAELTTAQDALARRVERTLPGATVRWHYRIVLDGIAVSLPTSELSALSQIPGVASVYPDIAYSGASTALSTGPQLIGADQLWGLPDFSTAGQGMKIGILDEGIDQAHPYFNPTGYSYPPGFPKGVPGYTTPKVIVARAFASPGETWQYAKTPFDPVNSDHATHVAGIAAGDYTVNAVPGTAVLSGVAPRAYLGNYKVYTVPTPEFGLDGNAPEIAAGVEAAVADGMDVINLSLGEPEIEPSRDIVVAAINGAAKAGVVPTIAAGNDFDDQGNGSITSPGNAAGAITAAAVTGNDVIASFSSAGPTPVSLEMKPDVSAPGVSILSSVPPREGTWAQVSGTSMAAPEVAGAAALLRQHHPGWTVAQVKSALVLTGKPVLNANGAEVPSIREGGGLIQLPAANDPLIFAAPTGISFGLVKTGTQAPRAVQLTDAGGGAGSWTVAVDVQDPTSGVSVTAPASITVPGSLSVVAKVAADARQADVTGFVVLGNGVVTRRIPFWLRSEHPRLEKPAATLTRAGIYHGNARLGQSRVFSYRYPEAPTGISTELPGPELVYRVVLPKRVSNFGVIVTGRGSGVSVTPRIVFPGDENRLLGLPALPLAENPYQDEFGQPEPVSAVIAPAAKAYDVVFDTPSRARAGAFTFRLWINDTTPPVVKLLTKTVSRGGLLKLSVVDSGSGVDPGSLVARVDGKKAAMVYTAGTVTVRLDGLFLTSGRHTVQLTASDWQETKNMESFGNVLPTTRNFSASFIVR